MRPLRQSMIDAMVVRGFSPSTQDCYVKAIYAMAKHYRRDPAEYTAHPSSTLCAAKSTLFSIETTT